METGKAKSVKGRIVEAAWRCFMKRDIMEQR